MELADRPRIVHASSGSGQQHATRLVRSDEYPEIVISLHNSCRCNHSNQGPFRGLPIPINGNTRHRQRPASDQ
jgi:hypothetical protein